MTTTDTDELTERLALAISEAEFCRRCEVLSTSCEACEARAAAVLPLIAVEVRKAKAEAWDEGCTEGDVSAYHGVAAKPNPYRATEEPR